MSIESVEQNPLGDDNVGVADRARDLTVPEPHGGEQNEDVVDTPTPDAFTHLMRDGKNRDWSLMDFFRGGDDASPKATDPDAAFGTGTRDRPTRDVSSAALQTRPIVPSNFDCRQIPLSSAVPVQVATFRPERQTIVLQNVTGDTVYIGSQPGNATPSTGYPIPAGSVLAMDATCAYWGSTDGSATLAVMDQFFTDNEVQ